MKILLTADWQAKFSNLDYCRRAHKQELSILKKYKIDVHVDLGDQKDDYNPIDGRMYSFMRRRSRVLSKQVAFSIRLMGNHDRFGQHSDSDNWLSDFDYASGRSIDTPQCFEYKGVTFACLPFRKTWKESRDAARLLAKKAAKSKNKVKLLLFHNDISGCTYSNLNTRESESKITMRSMRAEQYTMCFGGHVHLRQKLGKNGWFVGNPFATDMGEVDQQKGFLVYDTDKNTVKFIPSVVPGIFSWEYIKKHKPKSLPDGTKIRAVVKCNSSANYHQKLDEVSSAIEEKYPMAVSYVLPKFVDVSSKDEVIVDPESSDYQKIVSYIAATAPENLRAKKEQLAAYMTSVLIDVSGQSLMRTGGKLTFDSFGGENILSFKNVEYNLRNRGLVLVKGNNLDWPGHSNGSGKSNFLSIPPVVLFNKTFKGQKNDAWASDLNNKAARGWLKVIDANGRKIKISRGRRPSKLQMHVNGKDVSTGLRSIGKKETQGQVEEFLGYNFEAFANSVYIDQRMSNAFLSGTAANRAELIHSFQNLERFVLARKAVSKELIRLKQNAEVFESSVAVSERLLADVDEDAKASKHNSKGIVKKLRAEVDVQGRNLKRTSSATKGRLRILGIQFDKREVKEETLCALERKLENKIVFATKTFDALQDELRSLLLKKTSRCGTCYQTLTREALQNAKRQVSGKCVAHEKTIREASNKRTRIKTRLRKLRKAKQYLSGQIASIEAKVTKAQRAYEDSKERHISAKQAIEGSLKAKVKTNRKSIVRDLKRASRTIKSYCQEQEFLAYAIEAFSRDGLPAFLSNLLIPQLNKAAERYSKVFIDSEIQVIFEVEKGQITPKIINAHGAKTLQGQSAGENAWAGLITSFALREIAQPSNLLILDEPGNGLDPESAKKFGERLPRLKKMFETILVVTHNLLISSALEGENSLTVVKKHKRSRLFARK